MPIDWSVILTELRAKRSAIDGVIENIGRMLGTATIEPAVEPVEPHRPIRETKAAKPETKPLKSETKTGPCETHPNGGVTREGGCQGCRKAEYQKNWYAKRNKSVGTATAPKKRTLTQADANRPISASEMLELPENEELEADPDFDDVESTRQAPVERATAPATDFVYSKPTKCPKCSMGNVRLRRRKDADLSKDMWLHTKSDGSPSCQIKIAHYKIVVDSKY